MQFIHAYACFSPILSTAVEFHIIYYLCFCIFCTQTLWNNNNNNNKLLSVFCVTEHE